MIETHMSTYRGCDPCLDAGLNCDCEDALDCESVEVYAPDDYRIWVMYESETDCWQQRAWTVDD